MNSDTHRRIRVFDSAPALAEAAAAAFLEAARQARESGTRLHVALSGGSTPRALFRLLGGSRYATNIPWAAVHLYWADERCVPADHPESNFGVAWNLFLKYVPIPKENLHPVPTEGAPERACRLYAGILALHPPQGAAGLPCFDWIHLGMGTDGHTASLFPGNPDPDPEPAACALTRHPQTGQERVTLTLPVLNAARRVTFLVSGTDKAPMVAKILGEGEAGAALPAGRVAGPGVDWWLDADAASGLNL